jgi:hypothetical protein
MITKQAYLVIAQDIVNGRISCSAVLAASREEAMDVAVITHNAAHESHAFSALEAYDRAEVEICLAEMVKVEAEHGQGPPAESAAMKESDRLNQMASIRGFVVVPMPPYEVYKLNRQHPCKLGTPVTHGNADQVMRFLVGAQEPPADLSLS